MGTVVGFRDLPGGARKVRFAEELPRSVMCSACDMLSMEMYQDEQEHVFCHVCATVQSPAAAIFCKYENRDVPLAQLHEAFDVIEVIKDQVVFCPNEKLGCTAYSPLRDIEDHFLKCERTKLLCSQCQQRIKGINWRKHWNDCPRKIVQCCYCVTALPQIDLQTHEAVCTENPNAVQPESLPPSHSSSPSVLTASRPKSSFQENATVNEPVQARNRTSSDGEEAVVKDRSAIIPPLLWSVLEYSKHFSSSAAIALLRSNYFVRYFLVPFMGIVFIALYLRRRKR